jgi:N-acetylglucosamine-6-sulfatase
LADVQIPEPKSLWVKPSTWGSIATRGHNDELVQHIGTSIGRRNPRRSYAADLPKKFPDEFRWDYKDRDLSRIAAPNRASVMSLLKSRHVK